MALGKNPLRCWTYVTIFSVLIMSVTLVLFWLVKTQNAEWSALEGAAAVTIDPSNKTIGNLSLNHIFEALIHGQFLAYTILLNGLLLTALVMFLGGWVISRQRRDALMINTTKKSLAESELKLKEAFDNAAIGMALVDLEYKFFKVNRALQKTLGYQENEFEAFKVQDFIHPDDKLSGQTLQHLLENDALTSNSQRRFRTKNGQTIWGRLNLSLVKNDLGEAKYYVLQLENITREKLLDDIKSDFIAISSHQFRTPMAAIRWNLESIIDGDKGEIKDPKMKAALDKMHTSVVRMNNLIRDLLKVAKIEGRALKIKATPLKIEPLITDSLNAVASVVQTKNHVVNFVVNPKNKDLVACADKTIFAEAFKILLDNALNYGENSSPIKITLAHTSDQVVIEIENESTRISTDEREKMFEKLVRLEAGIKKNPDGSGLGLYSAKKLFEAMNATLTLEETNDEMVRFKIELKKI